MIILRTFSEKDMKDLLHDLLTDYMKKEKRSQKQKELVNKIKDIDPDKLKKGFKIAGLSTIGAGGLITGVAIGKKKLKKKIDVEKSNNRIKRQIAGEN